MGSWQRKYSLEPRQVPRVETAHRRIVTKLPVPESVAIFERLERVEPSSMQGQPPVIIDRTEGWHVHDRWGNLWLDWSSGVLISNIGNSNPVIVAALRSIWIGRCSPPTCSRTRTGPSSSSTWGALAPSHGLQGVPPLHGLGGHGELHQARRDLGPRAARPEQRVFVSFKNGFHGRTMGAQLAGGMGGAKRWMGRRTTASCRSPSPTGTRTRTRAFELFLETPRGEGRAARAGLRRHGRELPGRGPRLPARRVREAARGVVPGSTTRC